MWTRAQFKADRQIMIGGYGRDAKGLRLCHKCKVKVPRGGSGGRPISTEGGFCGHSRKFSVRFLCRQLHMHIKHSDALMHNFFATSVPLINKK